MRHKCKTLTQFEILPQPPNTRQPDNPWPEWPKIYRLDYGQEEAQARFGADPRRYLTTPERFIGDANGHVKELHTVDVEWTKGDNGALFPKKVPGTEKIWPAELVLLAMGFLGPEDVILEELGVQRDPRSNAQAEYGRFATNVKGIFAAGDMRRGQSLVVWAINEGRGAARECDRYLMGKTDLP
jgi:glutamate synthase (NADPH/NADH) small chain